MIEQSCTSWLNDLASSKPAPGGGGAGERAGRGLGSAQRQTQRHKRQLLLNHRVYAAQQAADVPVACAALSCDKTKRTEGAGI